MKLSAPKTWRTSSVALLLSHCDPFAAFRNARDYVRIDFERVSE